MHMESESSLTIRQKRSMDDKNIKRCDNISGVIKCWDFMRLVLNNILVEWVLQWMK